MNTIAIANQKGGVGKTTTSVNLAAGLAQHGQKVVLIDLDPQANATSHLGVESPEVTIEHVLKKQVDAGQATFETEVKGLYLIPSSSDLSNYEAQLASEVGRENKLKKALAPLDELVDFVLIDCPPSLDLMTINALSASDSVLIVTEGEFFSVGGTNRMRNLIEIVQQEINPSLRIFGIVMNKYNEQFNLNREVKEAFEQTFPDLLFETKIRKNIRLAETPSRGLPIQLYAPHCNGADDYNQLTEEVLKRCQASARL